MCAPKGRNPWGRNGIGKGECLAFNPYLGPHRALAAKTDIWRKETNSAEDKLLKSVYNA
jgi:hypothetical protein